MKSARVKIVNVKYKQVVRPRKFDHNQVFSDAKKDLDALLNETDKKPVAYFLCVFGEQRGEIYRAWHIPPKNNVISYAELPDILYNIALRG
ncbi:hypothetical protein GCM10027347_58840 [Larkinella harenae]